MKLTMPKRKMKKSWGSIEKNYLENFVLVFFVSENYVLYIFSSNEGGFVTSLIFLFVTWNADWSR